MQGHLAVGAEAWVLFSDSHDPNVWGRVFVPVRITKEFKRFYVCEVLPHYNRTCPFDISKPYHMTVDKHDILTGEVLIKKNDE